MGGKEKSLSLVIKLFLDDMPSHAEKLQMAIRQGQTSEAARYAHTIKGMVGNLSGHILKELAGQIEWEANKGNVAQLVSLWPEFLEQYQRLLECLNQDLAGQSSQAPESPATVSEVDKSSLPIKIHQVMQGLKQGDYIDPDEISALAPLLPPGQHDNLMLLRTYVSQFHVGAAVELLTQIISDMQITLPSPDDDIPMLVQKVSR